jgi:hypothetical protein
MAAVLSTVTQKGKTRFWGNIDSDIVEYGVYNCKPLRALASH